MGAYSELDIDRQYADVVLDDPFVEDDPFNEDDTLTPMAADRPSEAAAPAPVQDVKPQAEVTSTVPPKAEPTEAAAKVNDGKEDEDAKRKAHEEAEAKREAEWKTKQQQKKDAEKLALAKLDAMSDEEVLAASMKRISEDTEKLTRRNMMECVMEHIQTLCLEDAALARKVMHPRKNMIRCYQYINRKAWEYVQDEMKAKGIQPSRENPSYASAIPEGVCYQWAVDYFNDPDAKEDHEEEEKFVRKPYIGGSASKAKAGTKGKDKSTGKKESVSKKASPKKAPQAPADGTGQLSLGNFLMPEAKAG